jgi:hypothetical protein
MLGTGNTWRQAFTNRCFTYFLRASVYHVANPLRRAAGQLSTNDPIIIRNATIEDAHAIGCMVDEFRSYLQSLGDVHASVNFGSEQYRRDGFGPSRLAPLSKA